MERRTFAKAVAAAVAVVVAPTTALGETLTDSGGVYTWTVMDIEWDVAYDVESDSNFIRGVLKRPEKSYYVSADVLLDWSNVESTRDRCIEELKRQGLLK